jgi:hypothetical protein
VCSLTTSNKTLFILCSEKVAISSSPVQNPVFYPAIDKKIRTEGFNRNKGYFYATWSPKEGLRYSLILLYSSQEIL